MGAGEHLAHALQLDGIDTANLPADHVGDAAELTHRPAAGIGVIGTGPGVEPLIDRPPELRVLIEVAQPSWVIE